MFKKTPLKTDQRNRSSARVNGKPAVTVMNGYLLSKWKKPYTLTFLFLIGLQANAASFEKHLEKMKSVLRKDQRCDIAIVTVPANEEEKRKDYNWPDRVLCAGYLTFNEGTMSERSGCTAFVFNVNTGLVYPLIKTHPYDIAEGQKCDARGASQLMMKVFMTSHEENKKTTVSLGDKFSLQEDGGWRRQVLYVSEYGKPLQAWLKAYKGEPKVETIENKTSKKNQKHVELEVEQQKLNQEYEKTFSKFKSNRSIASSVNERECTYEVCRPFLIESDMDYNSIKYQTCVRACEETHQAETGKIK